MDSRITSSTASHNSGSATAPFCWLNGAFLPESAATLPANGAAALLGWGVFTTLGIFDSKPFALPLHLARWRRDAEKTRLDLVYSDVQIAAALQQVLKHNVGRNGIARITLLRRGDGRWNAARGCDLLIVARPENTASTRNTESARVLLSPHRINARRATVGVKSTSYLDALLAWQEARDLGFDEALLRNTDEKICEAGRSNVFWEHGGEAFTASLECGPLPGIGRALVLDWLRDSGVACHEGSFGLDELLRADAMWLSSSVGGVRAVAELCEYSRGETSLLCRFKTEGAMIAMLQSKWKSATRLSDITPLA